MKWPQNTPLDILQVCTSFHFMRILVYAVLEVSFSNSSEAKNKQVVLKLVHYYRNNWCTLKSAQSVYLNKLKKTKRQSEKMCFTFICKLHHTTQSGHILNRPLK